MFPDEPLSGDVLEAQQQVLLQKQEEHLRRMREQSEPPSLLFTASSPRSRESRSVQKSFIINSIYLFIIASFSLHFLP
jgi:hypothetical protein